MDLCLPVFGKQDGDGFLGASCFSITSKTTNQEMHNHKVNENHKTKHDLLIVQFSVIDVCSEMQKLPLSFGENPRSRFPVRTALKGSRERSTMP